MTITIEINPEIESQLQYAAALAGVAPETYIVGLLQQNLRRATVRHKTDRSLPRQEAELLQKINRSLSQIQWERYDQLVGKRQAETLTPEELDELMALSDQIEAANVRRIKYLAELARLRNTTVSALIVELGIKPRSHA
jgi:hypothetical protein